MGSNLMFEDSRIGDLCFDSCPEFERQLSHGCALSTRAWGRGNRNRPSHKRDIELSQQGLSNNYYKYIQ